MHLLFVRLGGGTVRKMAATRVVPAHSPSRLFVPRGTITGAVALLCCRRCPRSGEVFRTSSSLKARPYTTAPTPSAQVRPHPQRALRAHVLRRREDSTDRLTVLLMRAARTRRRPGPEPLVVGLMAQVLDAARACSPSCRRPSQGRGLSGTGAPRYPAGPRVLRSAAVRHRAVVGVSKRRRCDAVLRPRRSPGRVGRRGPKDAG